MKFIRSVGYMNWHLLRREPSRDFHMQHEIMEQPMNKANVHVESLSGSGLSRKSFLSNNCAGVSFRCFCCDKQCNGIGYQVPDQEPRSSTG